MKIIIIKQLTNIKDNNKNYYIPECKNYVRGAQVTPFCIPLT